MGAAPGDPSGGSSRWLTRGLESLSVVRAPSAGRAWCFTVTAFGFSFLDAEDKVSKLKTARYLWVFLSVPFYNIKTKMIMFYSLHSLRSEMPRVSRRFTFVPSSSKRKIKPCRKPSVAWKKGNFISFELCQKQDATKTQRPVSCLQARHQRVWPMCRFRGEPEKQPGPECAPRRQTEWVYSSFLLFHRHSTPFP